MRWLRAVSMPRASKICWPSIHLTEAKVCTRLMPPPGSKITRDPSPKRGYYHHHSRHSAGKPIVAGWSFQWIAQVSLRRDSWSAPVCVQRLEPDDNMQQVAARQIRALLARCPQHADLPIFVFDAGYDAVQLAHLLGDLPIALLVRLRSNRCFFAEPLSQPKQGRPRRHGKKFVCANATTWGEASMDHLTQDPQYGHVHIQAWPNLHAKSQQHPKRGTRQARPIIPGTLIRITVSRLPKQ